MSWIGARLSAAIILVGAMAGTTATAYDGGGASDDAEIAAQINLLKSADKSVRAAAIRELAHIGKPAGPALVSSLGDNRSEIRSGAAEVLRLMVTADPMSVPNRHNNEFWRERLNKVKVGMSLKDALATLFPDVTEADRAKTPMSLTASGQSATLDFRLDDYSSVELYREDDADGTMVAPGELIESVRRVWTKAPARFSGFWTSWYVNGQKCADNLFSDGVRNGPQISYYENGAKLLENHFVAGDETGIEECWYRSGAKEYEGQYTKEKMDGTWRRYFENGRPQSEETYKNGVLNGTKTTWREDGSKEEVENYAAGKLDGVTMQWDAQGNLRSTLTYKDGVIVGGNN